MSDTDTLTLLLAQHQRLNVEGKCTCGHTPPLGAIFHEHIAWAVMAAGWRPVRSAKRPAPE